MRISRHRVLVWLALVGALCPTWSPAQTVRHVPTTLATVPKGATAANPYWQHLVIELSRNPSAGNVIQVDLPADVTVADTDGDGSVEDEISLDGEIGQGTGYRSAAGSTASRLRIASTTGGVVGPVHVQFPIATATTPAAANAVYGPVAFSNGGEQTIPSGTLAVTFVAAHQLNLATPTRLFVDGVADTTTNIQGDRYPAVAAAAFSAPLPDLVSDRLGTLASNALTAAQVPFANGDDDDDVPYRFWLSTTDSLSAVDTTRATAALDAATGLAARASDGDSARIAFDVTGLAVGTYYLYLTSDLTGTFPLVRSRGVRVRHDPVVLSVGTFASGDPDWIDSGRLLGYDNGQTGPESAARDDAVIPVTAVDFDDSAAVRVFYAAAADLDTTDVTTSGTVPNRTIAGLAGASLVDTASTLQEGVDSTITWQVGPDDTTVVAAGDYYLYAVMTDGRSLAIGRSDTTYNVRHSPFLGLDARSDRTVNTGGPVPQRYYTITWNQEQGIDGDFDRDNGSAVIDLYYSDADTFRVPGDAAAIAAAAAATAGDTHRIVAGLVASADGRDDNQYVWDLWTYENPDDEGVPRPGRVYYLYGVITGGSTKRLVRWEDGAGNARSLTFVHDPHVTIRAPLAAVAADGRRSFRVAWEAADVDADAALWVILVPGTSGQMLGSSTTYGMLASGAEVAWVATSADGSLERGAPLSEDAVEDFAVRPAQLVADLTGAARPVRDGDYYAYVVIAPAAGDPPTADSPAVRAPGLITIDGLDPDGAQGLAAPALEILPARSTMETWRDTAYFEIRPNTAGQAVDVISVFLSVDTLLARVVDQDTSRAGTQPFAVNSDLPGLTLYDSVKAGADTTVAGLWVMDLVYFEQAGARFDGDRRLATVGLTSRNREGTATLRVDNLGARRSAFYRSGEEVGSVPPEAGAQIRFRPRATVSGQVRLQGRRRHAEQVTFQLRDRNSFAPIADSLFTAVNDVSTARAGLQDSTDAEGGFTLTQVPTGSFYLTAHVDRYLDGQYPALETAPGLQLTGVNPSFLADGAVQVEALLGGDVTGWVDTSGVSSPDNEVDQLDVDFITSYFGARTTPAHAGALADVDGDSLVWVADLNLVAANFAVAGVDPSYRAAAPSPVDEAARLEAARLEVVTQRDPGGRLIAQVRLDGQAELRAFGVTLEYDPLRWSPVGSGRGALFGARPAVTAFRAQGERLHLGVALVGAGAVSVPVGGELLGEAVFEPRFGPAASDPVASPLRAVAAGVIGADHRPRPVQLSAAALPTGYALSECFPNPFNPGTALRLQVPAPAPVTLTVYDAAGQGVRTLLAGTLAAGVHAVPWDGRDDEGRPVASGPYFARLAAPGFAAERKMLLVR